MRVYTDIHNLDLRSGLKLAIAAQFPDFTPQSIPLSLSFQRQGLMLRSALLLQWSASQKLDLAELQQQAVARFEITAPPNPPQIEQVWQWQVTATNTGWLEFQLLPQHLALWLDRSYAYLARPNGEAIARFHALEPPSFAWQYLRQRCRDLSVVAQDVADQGAPQWHFENNIIPTWEQRLLDGTVQLFLGLFSNKTGDRPLNTTDLNHLEQAFWEFHRHCQIFALYPAQPARFWHYCAWLQLVEAIAAAYLSGFTKT